MTDLLGIVMFAVMSLVVVLVGLAALVYLIS